MPSTFGHSISCLVSRAHSLRGQFWMLRAILIGAVFCAPAAWAVADDSVEFPPELTRFEPAAQNPIFTAEGPGHWDVKMRERGWILREGANWHLFYSGYDGTRAGIKRLGHATRATRSTGSTGSRT